MRPLIARIAAALCIAVASAALPGPAAAEIGEIRIGLQYGFIYLPITIADVDGLIDKRARELGLPGMKVTLNRFSGSAAVNEALVSGSIDFGAYGLPGLLIAWEKTRGKLAIKGLAGLALTAYVLDTNKPAIKSLADFAAQDKIALPASNSPQAILLQMAAEKTFGDYKRLDGNFVSLPHPDATTALLAGSAIAGYFATPPFSQILAKDSRIHPVLRSFDILGGKEGSGAGLGGSQRFVDANPKAAQALFLAIEDAMKLIATDPRRAADIYLKSEPQKLSNEEVQTLLQDRSTVYQVAPSGLMAYAEFMVKTGMLKTKPDSWRDVFFPYVYESGGN
jgi:ABC-type nitrate/sulfonate/bicarbonate transport system substrate-binding protein